jgi:hypothetical protein
MLGLVVGPHPAKSLEGKSLSLLSWTESMIATDSDAFDGNSDSDRMMMMVMMFATAMATSHRRLQY